MRVVYEGPSPRREVANTGGIVAERGKPVEVPAEVGRLLIERRDWKRAPRRKPRRSGGNGNNGSKES